MNIDTGSHLSGRRSRPLPPGLGDPNSGGRSCQSGFIGSSSMSRNLRVSVRIAARAVLVCLESRPAPLASQVPAGGGTAGGQRESTACMADRLHSPPPPLCRPAGPMKSSRKRSSSRFARPPDRPGVRAMCEPNRRAKHRGGQAAESLRRAAIKASSSRWTRSARPPDVAATSCQ